MSNRVRYEDGTEHVMFESYRVSTLFYLHSFKSYGTLRAEKQREAVIMPYAPIDDFLKVLETEAPAKVKWLFYNRHDVTHGLLPVGLKLHCIRPLLTLPLEFGDMLSRLGRKSGLELNGFKRQIDTFCLVLPPVGTAEAAITLVESIEETTKTKIFNNPDFQIQVCSPGRLDPFRAGILTMAFVLGSDSVPRLSRSDLRTTFSASSRLPRGIRLTIYDGTGALEREFEWWNRKRKFSRTFFGRIPIMKVVMERDPLLPFQFERTDVLTTTSRHDIRIVNLIATLLVHERHSGYWRKIGKEFIDEMRALIGKHQLSLTHIPWICTNEVATESAQLERDADDLVYWDALNETFEYLDQEAKRIQRGGAGGILFETHALLEYMREKVVSQAEAILYSARRKS